jgi:molybdate transport system substrate-binding protein
MTMADMTMAILMARRRLLAALVAALLPACAWAQAGSVPHVAAASDLQFALVEIARAFARDTGLDVKLTFGSSGNLRRQIAAGAPFELFLSADEAYVEALAREGRTEDAGTRYAIGRLVLFVPAGSPLEPDATLADLQAAVAAGRVKRFAIANPEHAPYGRAARDVLQRAGLWDALAPRLVLGENVSQAAQFASSGAAQGGIFAYSLALAPAIAGKGRAALLPAGMHAPLAQRMVLINGAGPTAHAFARYLQQPPAREVLRRHGFALPGE